MVTTKTISVERSILHPQLSFSNTIIESRKSLSQIDMDMSAYPPFRTANIVQFDNRHRKSESQWDSVHSAQVTMVNILHQNYRGALDQQFSFSNCKSYLSNCHSTRRSASRVPQTPDDQQSQRHVSSSQIHSSISGEHADQSLRRGCRWSGHWSCNYQDSFAYSGEAEICKPSAPWENWRETWEYLFQYGCILTVPMFLLILFSIPFVVLPY